MRRRGNSVPLSVCTPLLALALGLLPTTRSEAGQDEVQILGPQQELKVEKRRAVGTVVGGGVLTGVGLVVTSFGMVGTVGGGMFGWFKPGVGVPIIVGGLGLAGAGVGTLTVGIRRYRGWRRRDAKFNPQRVSWTLPIVVPTSGGGMGTWSMRF